jgi:ketosteroid isomerase-like protein
MDESGRTGRAEAAITEARAAFVSALVDGDAETASAVYADDARLFAPSTEPIRGRAEIEGFWRAGLEAGISDVKLEALELERADRLAYEIGRYSLCLRPATGETVVDRGRYVLVHAREADGSWRRAVEMFNPDAPPVAMQRARVRSRPRRGGKT